MRYRGAADETRILWINEAHAWQDIDRAIVPAVVAVIWFDQSTSWAMFAVEEVVYNADVSDYIRAAGP